MGRLLMVGFATTLASIGNVMAQTASVDVPIQEGENVSYAYADVMRANPLYDIRHVVVDVEECEEVPSSQPRRDRRERLSGSVLNDLTYGRRTNPAPTDQVCRVVSRQQEERQIRAYDVEYRYKGQVYMSQMDYDPGNKLRIRVTVAPAD